MGSAVCSLGIPTLSLLYSERTSRGVEREALLLLCLPCCLLLRQRLLSNSAWRPAAAARARARAGRRLSLALDAPPLRLGYLNSRVDSLLPSAPSHLDCLFLQALAPERQSVLRRVVGYSFFFRSY